MQQKFSQVVALALVLALASACAARTTTGLSQAGVATVQVVERVEVAFEEASAAGVIADSDYAEALSVLDDAYEAVEAAAVALEAGHEEMWQTQMDALLVMADQLATITGRSESTRAYTALAVEAFRMALFSLGISR